MALDSAHSVRMQALLAWSGAGVPRASPMVLPGSTPVCASPCGPCSCCDVASVSPGALTAPAAGRGTACAAVPTGGSASCPKAALLQPGPGAAAWSTC